MLWEYSDRVLTSLYSRGTQPCILLLSHAVMVLYMLCVLCHHLCLDKADDRSKSPRRFPLGTLQTSTLTPAAFVQTGVSDVDAGFHYYTPGVPPRRRLGRRPRRGWPPTCGGTVRHRTRVAASFGHTETLSWRSHRSTPPVWWLRAWAPCVGPRQSQSDDNVKPWDRSPDRGRGRAGPGG